MARKQQTDDQAKGQTHGKKTDKKKKKAKTPHIKKKHDPMVTERNRRIKQERHLKRVIKQSEKKLRVPHGTARARNMPQRVASRTQKQADKKYALNYWAQLAESFKQAERERKAAEKKEGA
jgi:hypothetical protein